MRQRLRLRLRLRLGAGLRLRRCGALELRIDGSLKQHWSVASRHWPSPASASLQKKVTVLAGKGKALGPHATIVFASRYVMSWLWLPLMRGYFAAQTLTSCALFAPRLSCRDVRLVGAASLNTYVYEL